MLTTRRKSDGTYDVSVPWRAQEPELCELEALIATARRMNVLIRVCKDRDRAGNLRPAKAILAVDPARLIGV